MPLPVTSAMTMPARARPGRGAGTRRRSRPRPRAPPRSRSRPRSRASSGGVSGMRLRWIRRDSAISASRRWAALPPGCVLVGRARERRERVASGSRPRASTIGPSPRPTTRPIAALPGPQRISWTLVDRGVVRDPAGRGDEPAVHVLDDDGDPEPGARERVDDRPEPLRCQRVAADDLARDDLAGSDRWRATVSAQRTGLRTPRWRRRGLRG